MLIKTSGIVIKENNVGEQDRLITLLTEKLGVIRAFARGARNIKSKSLSATRLFCYSDITLYCGKDKYVIREIEPKEVFFNICRDIEKIALCQYFSQLIMELAPAEENAKDYLRLMLNSVNYICKGTKPDRQIKSIFEMRLLSMAGYMPDLQACASCGAFESTEMFFNTYTGQLYCSECGGSGSRIDINIVTALRYIIYSDFEKLFAFSVTDKCLDGLCRISEKFLVNQTQRNYKTLDFYNSLHTV